MTEELQQKAQLEMSPLIFSLNFTEQLSASLKTTESDDVIAPRLQHTSVTVV